MSMLCTLLMLQNAISVDMVSQGLRRNFSSPARPVPKRGVRVRPRPLMLEDIR